MISWLVISKKLKNIVFLGGVVTLSSGYMQAAADSFPFALAPTGAITLACNDWKPFVQRASGGRGVIDELVDRIAQEAEIDVKVRMAPWKRVMAELDQGKIEGSYCMSFTKERAEKYHYMPSAIYQAISGIFSRRKNPVTLKEIKAGQGFTIAVIPQSYGERRLQKRLPDHVMIQQVANHERGMRMLQRQRFDGLYMVKLSGDYLLHSLLPELRKDIMFSQIMDYQTVHIALRRDLPNAIDLIGRLQKAYEALQQRGDIAHIIDQYENYTNTKLR